MKAAKEKVDAELLGKKCDLDDELEKAEEAMQADMTELENTLR